MPSSKQIIGLMLSVILLESPIALAQDQSPAYARVVPADLKWGPLPSMSKGHKLPFCMVAPRSPACSQSTLNCLRISNYPCILTQTSGSVQSFLVPTIPRSAIGRQLEANGLSS